LTDSDIINVGVLASGRGSNFAALLAKQNDGYFAKAKLTCLISNRAEAPALEIAKTAGLDAYHVSRSAFPSHDSYEEEIKAILEKHNVQWLILAGYMKIIGPVLLSRFPNRVLNIHPALLPAFPGLHAQRQALEYGVRVSGCTVHFVDGGVDTGPIISQRTVEVLPGDTEQSLSSRILEQEHELFAEALKAVTEGNWHIHGRRVIFE